MQVFAGFDNYSVYRKGTGYAAKEEPYRKDEQQQGCDTDKQTLARCGNRQQPVELFAFFFRFGNCLVK